MIFLPIVGVFAAIGLMLFIVLGAITGKPGVALKNGLTITAIVCLGIVGWCAVTNISTALGFQEVSCQEIPIEGHYKFIASKLLNGSETGTFGKSDSEQYQPWITHYAIARHYLVGQANRGRTSAAGYEYFWIDLLTNKAQRFTEYDQYLQSLRALGFEKEPDLSPIGGACSTNHCQSCSSPRFQE